MDDLTPDWYQPEESIDENRPIGAAESSDQGLQRSVEPNVAVQLPGRQRSSSTNRQSRSGGSPRSRRNRDLTFGSNRDAAGVSLVPLVVVDPDNRSLFSYAEHPRQREDSDSDMSGRPDITPRNVINTSPSNRSVKDGGSMKNIQATILTTPARSMEVAEQKLPGTSLVIIRN